MPLYFSISNKFLNTTGARYYKWKCCCCGSNFLTNPFIITFIGKNLNIDLPSFINEPYCEGCSVSTANQLDLTIKKKLENLKTAESKKNTDRDILFYKSKKSKL